VYGNMELLCCQCEWFWICNRECGWFRESYICVTENDFEDFWWVSHQKRERKRRKREYFINCHLEKLSFLQEKQKKDTHSTNKHSNKSQKSSYSVNFWNKSLSRSDENVGTKWKRMTSQKPSAKEGASYLLRNVRNAISGTRFPRPLSSRRILRCDESASDVSRMIHRHGILNDRAMSRYLFRAWEKSIKNKRELKHNKMKGRENRERERPLVKGLYCQSQHSFQSRETLLQPTSKEKCQKTIWKWRKWGKLSRICLVIGECQDWHVRIHKVGTHDDKEKIFQKLKNKRENFDFCFWSKISFSFKVNEKVNEYLVIRQKWPFLDVRESRYHALFPP